MRCHWVLHMTPNSGTSENPYVSGEGFLYDSEDALRWGDPVDNWGDQAWVRPDTPEACGDLDDWLLNHFGLPLLSGRLKAALDSAGITGIQFLPVTVLAFAGEVLTTYYLASVASLENAVDLTRTIHSRFPDDFPNPHVRGKVRGMREVVVRKDAVQGHDLFRLSEGSLSLYCSDRFRSVCEDGGFRGAEFQEIGVSADA